MSTHTLPSIVRRSRFALAAAALIAAFIAAGELSHAALPVHAAATPATIYA